MPSRAPVGATLLISYLAVFGGYAAWFGVVMGALSIAKMPGFIVGAPLAFQCLGWAVLVLLAVASWAVMTALGNRLDQLTDSLKQQTP